MMKDYQPNATQTFRSHYGRKGIRVDAKVPTIAIRHRLGRVHVGTPDAQVEKLIRDEIERQVSKGAAGWTEKMIEQTVRFALWEHHENRAEYGYVMGAV